MSSKQQYAGQASPRRRASGFGSSPLTVREHDSIDGAALEPYWEMYEAAFAPLRVLAAGRQVLTRAEFATEMHDPRVRKHVAYDAAERPIALLTMTRDFEAVPWISPEYYANRYPEEFARQSVYYLGFILVSPQHQGAAVMERLVDVAVLQPLAAQRGVLAFDTCAHNDDLLRFTQRIRGILRRHSPVDWQMSQVDVQRYYDLSWS